MPSGGENGAAQGQAVSSGVAVGTDGVSAALVVAVVSCKGSHQDAGQHAAGDPGGDEAPLAGSAQGVPEEGSGHQWAVKLCS